MYKPKILLVATIDAARGLSKAGRTPWHIPDDIERLHRLAKGHSAIVDISPVGQAFRELSKELDKRLQEGYIFETVEAAQQAAIPFCMVFVVGGAKTFEESLPLADLVLMTEIEGASFGCDETLPSLDMKRWKEAVRTGPYVCKYSGLTYWHVTYGLRKKTRTRQKGARRNDNLVRKMPPLRLPSPS